MALDSVGMKHAILILCHESLDKLENLMSCFNDDFRFYIHIDKKCRIDKSNLKCFEARHPNSKVFSKYRVNWGGIGILKAEIYLLKQIVKDVNADYIHILSGQDYPIKSLDEFNQFFKNFDGKQYVEYHQIPAEKWENGTYSRFELYRLNDYFDYRTARGKRIINWVNNWQIKHNFRRNIPNQFPKLFGGSNWMSLTFDCAKYVVDMLPYNRKFFNRLRFTFASDEVYFHTVILNSPFKDSVVNDNKRLVRWDKRSQRPSVLTERDWFEVATSDKLFARKFVKGLSDNLEALLQKYMLRHTSVEVSGSGYWCQNSLYGHVFDSGLARALCSVVNFCDVKTLGDFGCGPGWYVAMFRRMGIDAQGYDGNPFVETMSRPFFNDGFFCQQIDLTEELGSDEPFQMVMSLEVGEHIPEISEAVFIDNLVRNASKYILLSWGIPGQPGFGHINCKSNEYIAQKFRERGFYLNVPISNYLRVHSSNIWFKKTIMFFEKLK